MASWIKNGEIKSAGLVGFWGVYRISDGDYGAYARLDANNHSRSEHFDSPSSAARVAHHLLETILDDAARRAQAAAQAVN